MKTLIVTSQKGGSGKTTLAAHLAVEAERNGDSPSGLIDTDKNRSVLALADLVLIPVRPSPADLWAVSETVALVKEANKPFLFVITQAKAQASITAPPSPSMAASRNHSLPIGCLTPWR